MATKLQSGSTRLLVLLERDQHAALKMLSASTGAPMNHHVRRAVAEYLARQRDDDTVDALLPPVRVRRQRPTKRRTKS